LYKFRGNHFDGYILRYDAVTNGAWRMVADTVNCASHQKPLPQYSAGFPIGRDGWYDYSPPLNDPRYVRPAPHNYDSDWRYNWKFFCRAAEPSQDELVGLVAGYFMLFSLVQDPAIQAQVRQQVMALADYLAEHGYFLVRPGGGLAGGAGHALLLEFPA